MYLFFAFVGGIFFGMFIGYSVCHVQQQVKKRDKKRRLTEMSSFSEEWDKEPDERWNNYEDYEKADNT